MKYGIFKTWETDPVSVILETGFMQFTTAFGIEGLAKVIDGTLQILAVVASNPGTGQFRRFIEGAKRRFPKVVVMHDMNPIIEPALTRYGFHRETITESDGEQIPALVFP